MDDVQEFALKMGQPLNRNLGDDASLEVDSIATMRRRLIREEHEEFQSAFNEVGRSRIYRFDRKGDEPGYKKLEAAALKELADLVYVCYGLAASFGWPLDEALRRVHESNLSKLGEDGKPIYREDGKVLKGPNYKPANLEDLV